MTKYKIQDIMKHYENYKVKIKGKWYFVSPRKLENAIKGTSIKGKIVKKRTRTWIE